MISKKISYFLTLAECLSFTQTAARYEVSQTAVSQYIASLEERIGFRLFDRNRHNVALTEAGNYYYQHVKALVLEYNSILDHAKVITDGYHGCLKVGVGMYEYCSTEALFSAFLTNHPEIRVDILQFPYSELIEKLRSGDLDVIIADSICEASFSRREIRTRKLFDSYLSMVANDTVTKRGDNNAVQMLRNECLITNCESDGPSSTQMLSILLQDEYGFAPEKMSQTNSVNAQMMMVRAGHGIAIVPDFVVDLLCPDLIRFPFPSKRTFCYELICMTDCKNEAAEQLFSFSV